MKASPSSLIVLSFVLGGCALLGAIDGTYIAAESEETPASSSRGGGPSENGRPADDDPRADDDDDDRGSRPAPCEDTCPSGACRDGQCVPWFQVLGTNSFTLVRRVAVGPTGAVYVAGQYEDRLDLADRTHVAAGGFDGFIAKYNRVGEYLWSRSVGGAGYDDVTGLVVDRDGRATIAFNCESSRVEGDESARTFGGFGQQDVCVVQYGQTGELQWVADFGSVQFESVRDLTLVGEDVVMVGTFDDAIDFGPFELDALVPTGFVTRLDGKSGQPLWAKSIEADAFARVSAVDATHDGPIHITGMYVGPAAVAGAALPYSGFGEDIFVARLDRDTGRPLWSAHLSAAGGNGWADVGDVASIGADAVIVGWMAGTWEVDGGSPLTGPESTAGFVLRIGPSGVAWHHRVEDASYSEIRGASRTGDGDLILTGLSSGSTASFENHPLGGSSDELERGFFAQVTAFGAVEGATGFSGAGSHVLGPAAVAEDDNLFLAGELFGEWDLGSVRIETGFRPQGVLVSYGAY